MSAATTIARVTRAAARVYEIHDVSLFPKRDRWWPLCEARMLAEAALLSLGVDKHTIAAAFNRSVDTIEWAANACARRREVDTQLRGHWERLLAAVASEDTAESLLRELVYGDDNAIADVLTRARKFLEVPS